MYTNVSQKLTKEPSSTYEPLKATEYEVELDAYEKLSNDVWDEIFLPCTQSSKPELSLIHPIKKLRKHDSSHMKVATTLSDNLKSTDNPASIKPHRTRKKLTHSPCEPLTVLKSNQLSPYKESYYDIWNKIFPVSFKQPTSYNLHSIHDTSLQKTTSITDDVIVKRLEKQTKATRETTIRFSPVIVKSSKDASTLSAAVEEEDRSEVIYECIDDYDYVPINNGHLQYLETVRDQCNTNHVTRSCQPLPAIPHALCIRDSLNASTLKSVCNMNILSHRLCVMIAGFILTMYLFVAGSLAVYNIPKRELIRHHSKSLGMRSYL